MRMFSAFLQTLSGLSNGYPACRLFVSYLGEEVAWIGGYFSFNNIVSIKGESEFCEKLESWVELVGLLLSNTTSEFAN